MFKRVSIAFHILDSLGDGQDSSGSREFVS